MSLLDKERQRVMEREREGSFMVQLQRCCLLVSLPQLRVWYQVLFDSRPKIGIVIFVFLYIVSGWCSTLVFFSSSLLDNRLSKLSTTLNSANGVGRRNIRFQWVHSCAEDLRLRFFFWGGGLSFLLTRK